MNLNAYTQCHVTSTLIPNHTQLDDFVHVTHLHGADADVRDLVLAEGDLQEHRSVPYRSRLSKQRVLPQRLDRLLA